MVSLGRVIERMDEKEEVVLESLLDSKAITAIRAGLHLRPDFWDDFLRLCNQPAIAELFGIRKEVIARWPARVREGLATVQHMDGEEAATKKAGLIKTGY